MVLSVFLLAYAVGPLFLVCTNRIFSPRQLLLNQSVILDIESSGVLDFRLRRHD